MNKRLLGRNPKMAALLLDRQSNKAAAQCPTNGDDDGDGVVEPSTSNGMQAQSKSPKSNSASGGRPPRGVSRKGSILIKEQALIALQEQCHDDENELTEKQPLRTMRRTSSGGITRTDDDDEDDLDEESALVAAADKKQPKRGRAGVAGAAVAAQSSSSSRGGSTTNPRPQWMQSNLGDPNAKLHYWHRMAVRSSHPTTPPNEIARRSAFMLMSSLTCGAGLIWSGMYILLNEYTAAIFPATYSVMMTACFLLCTKAGRYHTIVATQLLLILVLPICLQLVVGGIVKAGGVMMWSFLCPLGAALFCRPTTAKRWFGVYMLSMIGTILTELGSTANASPVVLGPLEVGLFLMNVCGSMCITFLGALVFSIKLDEEYSRSEDLLHNILPRSIAKRLKEGECHIVDNFDGATILFADLVGFTKASAEMHPNFLIGMFLRDVFSAWDELCTKRQLEKIKTIGDAFMAVGGLAEDEADTARGDCRVAEKIVLLGLEMMEALVVVNKRYGMDFQVRIGIHSGPVIAGVIGVKKFAFDVWGDAVNTASRMESHGTPGCIQISSETYLLIKHLNFLDFRCCGEVNVKGKGIMTTYLVKKRYDDGVPLSGGSSSSGRSNPQNDSSSSSSRSVVL